MAKIAILSVTFLRDKIEHISLNNGPRIQKHLSFPDATEYKGGGGVGQSIRSLKCPGQSVRRESQSVRRENQSVRGESQSVRGRSPPRSMCYKHRRSRHSGTYEPLAIGSIETYIFYFYLTSIHIIYKVAKPNQNVVGPGRID